MQREYGRGYRGNNHYRRSHSQEEEPEWFSSGPTSQNDTIELRGFEPSPEERVQEEQRAEQEQYERNEAQHEQEKAVVEMQQQGERGT